VQVPVAYAIAHGHLPFWAASIDFALLGLAALLFRAGTARTD